MVREETAGDEGVRAVRRKKPQGQPRLDRERIVAAALRLLNEVGLDGLTLRKLAAELNVQAPALYWHVKNKQQLLDEMATGMLRELRAEDGEFGTGPGAGSRTEPGAAPVDGPGSGTGPAAASVGGSLAGVPGAGDWQAWLAREFRLLRRVLLRHRDGAKVFAGTRLTDIGHAAAQDRLLGRLVEAGFAPGAAARASFLVFAFTEGFVIEEQAVYPMPGERDPRYDVEKRAAAIGEEFALSASAGAEVFDDYEERFEEGLAALVAGIAVTLGPAAPSRT